MASMQDVQEEEEDIYNVTEEQRVFAKELATNIVKVMKDRDLFSLPGKPGVFFPRLPDGSTPVKPGKIRYGNSFSELNVLDIKEALRQIARSQALADFMRGGPQLLLEYAKQRDEFTNETVYKKTPDDFKIELLQERILGLFHQQNAMGIGLPTRSFDFGLGYERSNLTVGNVGSLRPKPGPEEIRDQIVGEAARAVSANTVSPRALKTAVELRALKHGTHVEMDPRFSRYVSGALRTNQPPERKKTLTEALGREYLRVKSAPYKKK